MSSTTPLAERMRPHILADYIGQEHLVGKNGILSKTIASGYIPSLLLWGPPGVGKTTLAQIIASELKRPFFQLSAINSGVKDIREILDKANGNNLFTPKSPILFIDEIHRFSKSQQDSLLGAVEKGQVTLIGATTENPSFEVISALLSRCQVYVLEHHSKEELIALLTRALDNDVELKKKKITIGEYDALLRFSGGDARRLLNIFELIVNAANSDELTITNDFVTNQIQTKSAIYDKDGEQHYDIISAFIKSIRGSDPNAAVYYLARMIEGGEDPLFICRRLIIVASEDIGNANPNALLLATACQQAVSTVGWPESRIILSQAVTYLASSPKSNAAYMAIDAAQKLVKETGDLPIPLHLRNAPTQLMKNLNYGKDYQYAHQFENNFIYQEYLPDAVKNTKIYDPGNNARENELRNYLKRLWQSKYGY